MTSKWKWRIRRTDPWMDGAGYIHHQYVGVKNKAKIYGDTIAEVMDGIAFKESEVP